jgi:hypothetical protein
MVLLEQHYRMSAHEAWNVRPAWEIDVKLAAVMPPARDEDDGELMPDDDADPFAAAPAWVGDLNAERG